MLERAWHCLKFGINEASYECFLRLVQLCPFLAYEFKAEVLGGDILARRIAPFGTASPRCILVLIAADAVTVTADCQPPLVTPSLRKASLCIRSHLASMATVVQGY